MAKIREDLVGVVDVDGHTLSAGDTVPDGVTVGDHVLEAEKPVAEKPVKRQARKGDDGDKQGE